MIPGWLVQFKKMASRIKTGEQWLELVNDGNVPLVKALAKKV